MSLGDFIAKRRNDIGLTLADIAKHVGVSEATVQRWEKGTIADMKYTRVIKLAEALRVHPWTLLKLADNGTENTEAAMHNYTDITVQLMDLVSKLPPDQQAAALALLRGATSREE